MDLREVWDPLFSNLADLVLITVDGRIVKRAVAFDTDAKTVEVLAGDGDNVIALAHLDEQAIAKAKLGNYRGLGTILVRGAVSVYVQVRGQAQLTHLMGLRGERGPG